MLTVSFKAPIYQTDIRELAVTKANCCFASRLVHLLQKAALELAKTTAGR